MYACSCDAWNNYADAFEKTRSLLCQPCCRRYQLRSDGFFLSTISITLFSLAGQQSVLTYCTSSKHAFSCNLQRLLTLTQYPSASKRDGRPCKAMESLCHEALGPTDAKLKILYINPNSTISFTQETVEYLRDRLPADVLMDFFTPSSAAPPSIDGTADGVLSSAAVMQEMGLTGPSRKAVAEAICKRYSAIIVSCFSAHPLVPSLKEVLASIQTQPPVLGIFEAGVYTCLQLGHTFGIATTGLRALVPDKYSGSKLCKLTSVSHCFRLGAYVPGASSNSWHILRSDHWSSWHWLQCHLSAWRGSLRCSSQSLAGSCKTRCQ